MGDSKRIRVGVEIGRGDKKQEEDACRDETWTGLVGTSKDSDEGSQPSWRRDDRGGKESYVAQMGG